MTALSQLAAKQLSCIRQDKSIFADVSFTLQAGEALLVQGPNGTGKSSLLRLIAGIATPAEGVICWNEHTLGNQRSDYTEQLHYLGHSSGIRSGLTIAENLTLASALSEHRIADMDTVLTRLKLSADKNTPTQFLSAGQKRRVALARLFLIPRTLWILDEPLTSLDADTQQTLLAEIATHLRHGGMCVITSHQPIDFHDAPIKHLELAPC